MSISKEEVKHIAMLSRLEFNEEEITIFQDQLSRILDYVAKLNEIDTESIEPTSHVIELKNVLREDTVKASLPIDQVLKNAPDPTENFFRVPKIIE